MQDRMKCLALVGLSIASGALLSCIRDRNLESIPAAQTGQKTPGSNEASENALKEIAADSCMALPNLPAEPPVFVKSVGAVLTRLFNPCVTRQGQQGWLENTPWLSMGFPCTGGQGRIDIKGNYYAPKMVSFIIGTDCPMEPSGSQNVAKLMSQAVGLPPKAHLMGYTPFVVQFWEIPSINAADTGFSVELRSAAGTEGAWKRFRDHKEPLRVRLYGRENVWTQGDHIFQVDADLHLAGRTAFKLAVIDAKALSKEEIAAVKGRCEALRPLPNCGEVF